MVSAEQVLRLPMDQRSLRAAHRMSALRSIVELNRSDPAMNHSGILSCRQMRRRVQPAWEAIVGGLQSPSLDPLLKALPSLLRDLELNCSLSLLLHDRCARPCVATLADLVHEQMR